MNQVKIRPENSSLVLVLAIKQGVDIPGYDVSENSIISLEQYSELCESDFRKRPIIIYDSHFPWKHDLFPELSEDPKIFEFISENGIDPNESIILFADSDNQNLYVALHSYDRILPTIEKLAGFRSLWGLTSNPFLIYRAARWFEEYKGLDLSQLDLSGIVLSE